MGLKPLFPVIFLNPGLKPGAIDMELLRPVNKIHADYSPV